MSKPKNYVVKVWHLERDEVFTYNIPWAEACSQATSVPNRTIAGIRGRERCAMELGENYDSAIHKVLSVTEEL